MRERPKLLVVDDGDRYIELAHAFLRDYDYATRCDLEGPCWTCPKRQGCTLTHAHDAGEADETLLKHSDVDVVLLDVAFDVPEARLLPSSEKLSQRRRFQGLQILEHLRRQRGDLPVVLMTSKDDLASDREHALRADEFVSLAGEAAFDARALSLLVERVLARRRESPEAGGYTWGKTAAMAKLRRDVQALARTSLPMLVLGETGTGKSALAERVIHPATRRKGPFIAIDLASIPESLAASELFGTARGAFSGALDRKGRFEEAHGGTLFLDEIGNLPIEARVERRRVWCRCRRVLSASCSTVATWRAQPHVRAKVVSASFASSPRTAFTRRRTRLRCSSTRSSLRRPRATSRPCASAS